ncbi:MAG TPA: 1,6-anhydro-N-acetylmuramyl-L-alanine amidase AmpD [Thioploca sp.]|nr:1,6-anhydro-N-acetylmuramyl-L-alanine amidase AmpD [Thioploca sp.]
MNAKNLTWMKGVRYCPSPNFDERTANIELLVIHSISLPAGKFGGPFIDQLFTNSLDNRPDFAEIINLRVSAHLLIRRDGEIVQYVALDKRAWHAGISSFNGRTKCNDFSIGIELEGCDDVPYTGIQYQKLAKVTKILQQTWPSLTNIAGHCDIAPKRKTDPGPLFDWERFKNSIR